MAGPHRGGVHPGAHPHRPVLHGRGPQLQHGHPGHRPGRHGHDRWAGDACGGSEHERQPAGACSSIDGREWLTAAAWRRRFREQPAIAPLLLLLALLVRVAVHHPARSAQSTPAWATATIRFATPLALLAACQTLTMLTGGIDLSVATIATVAGFVMAIAGGPAKGPLLAILLGIRRGAVLGLVNGIGIGYLPRPALDHDPRHWARRGRPADRVPDVVSSRPGPRVPEPITWLAGGTSFGFFPNCLLLFVPLASADHLRASTHGLRTAAVRGRRQPHRVTTGWRSHLAGAAVRLRHLQRPRRARRRHGRGRHQDGRAGCADTLLLPSVAAAVIGGTSIFGGRGGYSGTIVGALILTVLASLLTVLNAPQPVRIIVYGADHPGSRRRVRPHDRRPLEPTPSMGSRPPEPSPGA